MHAHFGRTEILGAVLLLSLNAAPSYANDDPLFQLQQQWWQWAGSIPIDVNPLVDTTGKYCDAGQHGPHWFLAGNFGGRTTRDCTVPKGVKLVVPVLVTFCYPEEGFDTDASCIEYIKDALAGYRRQDLTVKLDDAWQETRDICEVVIAPGDAVPSLPGHCVIRRRADRTLFSFVVGESGFYFSGPGVWRANAARGVWSVIDTSKLTTGRHVLRIKAIGGADAPLPPIVVTYNLRVKKAQN